MQVNTFSVLLLREVKSGHTDNELQRKDSSVMDLLSCSLLDGSSCLFGLEWNCDVDIQHQEPKVEK